MNSVVEDELVPGRHCDGCDVCCVALTIEDPELKKVQGVPCLHLVRGVGCSIYADRPSTCRRYECGWRRLRWVRPSLRPDRSGVLVRLHGVADRASGEMALGVIFAILRPQGLEAEGLEESVAAAVAAGVPVFLEVPGRPGYTSSRARLNDALFEAVTLRDRAGLRAILRQAYTLGRQGKRQRVRLANASPNTDGGAD